MWVKICGNTNLEDAAGAAEQGADAVGFIFAKSPRRVTVAQVAAITPQLPAGVERVGVFDTQGAEEIIQVVKEAGLTGVQLHGELDEGLIVTLAKTFEAEVTIIQTLHWVVGDSGSAGRLAGEMWRLRELVAERGMVDRLLLDSKVAEAGGGTGVTFDWTGARAVLEAVPSGVRLIVAGGLRPGNVAEAIAQLRPWGVDVASGVEAPGRKDPALVARFIENARGAKTP
jgi:phosphoribosylanthranilate isomerase